MRGRYQDKEKRKGGRAGIRCNIAEREREREREREITLEVGTNGIKKENL